MSAHLLASTDQVRLKPVKMIHPNHRQVLCTLKQLIPLESAFNGLQFRRWHYRSIFIRLVVVASQSRQIARNSEKIWPYSSSRSSKVIDLGVNRKPMYDFLLVTNSNFDRICYGFRDIDAWSKKIAEFLRPTLVWGSRSGGNPLEFGGEIWRQKTRVLGLDTILARERQTDRRTDGHVAIAITRASIASRG